MPAVSHAAMPAAVGSTRGTAAAGPARQKRAALGTGSQQDSAGPVGQIGGGLCRTGQHHAACGQVLAGRSRRWYSTPPPRPPHGYCAWPRWHRGWVASTQSAAPCRTAAISPASSRPARTVMPSARPCSSAPRSVATQTVTAAPSAASAREKVRPSVVPLKTTALIRRDTPLASPFFRPDFSLHRYL